MVEFSDPPAARGGSRRVNWPKVAAELEAHLGEWAKVGTFSSAVARQIRAGQYASLIPEGTERGSDKARRFMDRHYEVTSRSDGDGKWVIYMRRIR